MTGDDQNNNQIPARTQQVSAGLSRDQGTEANVITCQRDVRFHLFYDATILGGQGCKRLWQEKMSVTDTGYILRAVICIGIAHGFWHHEITMQIRQWPEFLASVPQLLFDPPSVRIEYAIFPHPYIPLKMQNM